MSNSLNQGYLALPPTENPAPAVMVLHAWWGLNDFFKQFCDRLAALGYVVFAPDLYDGTVVDTIEAANAMLEGLDHAKANALVRQSLAALRQHPRTNGEPVGLIGFSLGGFKALYLLKDIPEQIKALVVFYSTVGGMTTFPDADTAVLLHFAETDDFEPQPLPQELEESLEAANIDTTVYTYPNTGHWFFEADRPDAYNADAADLAWQRTTEFLKTHL